LDVWFGAQDSGQSLSHHRMIVRDQNPNNISWRGSHEAVASKGKPIN
jgi:hypothetical protein